MNNEKALGLIGGKKEKLLSKQNAFRLSLGALTVVTAFAVVDKIGSLAGREQSNPPAADVGNNNFILTAPGLHETLFAEPNSPGKGQLVKVTWGPNQLSSFTKELIVATPSAGKSTDEKVLAGQHQAEMVTNTIETDGVGLQADTTTEMKIPVDTNIAELNQLEKPYYTKIKPVK